MEENGKIWYIGFSKRHNYYIEVDGRTLGKFDDRKDLRAYVKENGRGVKLKFKRGMDKKTQKTLENSI